MNQINQYLSQIALLIVPVLFSITVHEVCHGYAAYLFGDPTAKMAGRLTFNPVRHIDPIGLLVLFVTRMIGWAKPVPVDPRYFKRPRQDMVWVSLAGPASNLVLAAATALVLKLIGPVLASTALYPLVIMLQMMVMINVGLAVFNLIPIHPLDGSHIMEGLLPAKLAYSYSKLQPYGFIILLLLIFTRVVDIVIAPIIHGIVYVLLS
ncbi:MAG TPA: site-2 protease family protein [Deltaproteobacteria bacterium]|nr:site-2 protease family protein [Deltaproteobacteria bacterium]HXK46861.1 site-2 protease family protein [Deltaproteobacteria bacterium]